MGWRPPGRLPQPPIPAEIPPMPPLFPSPAIFAFRNRHSQQEPYGPQGWPGTFEGGHGLKTENSKCFIFIVILFLPLFYFYLYYLFGLHPCLTRLGSWNLRRIFLEVLISANHFSWASSLPVKNTVFVLVYTFFKNCRGRSDWVACQRSSPADSLICHVCRSSAVTCDPNRYYVLSVLHSAV